MEARPGAQENAKLEQLVAIYKVMKGARAIHNDDKPHITTYMCSHK